MDLAISTAWGIDCTLTWTYPVSEEANIDGFYTYMSGTSPVNAVVANRVATTAKNLRQHTLTGISVGQHYVVMTAYKGTIESEKSNEVGGVAKPMIPGGVVIQCTQ